MTSNSKTPLIIYSYLSLQSILQSRIPRLSLALVVLFILLQRQFRASFYFIFDSMSVCVHICVCVCVSVATSLGADCTSVYLQGVQIRSNCVLLLMSLWNLFTCHLPIEAASKTVHSPQIN